jgi:HAD superfamily hydrolase (TIGR01509 family)
VLGRSDVPAVVVDCDGLLVDTGAAWKAAAAAVFPHATGYPAGASVEQLVELYANGSSSEHDRLAERLTGELVAAVGELGRPLPGAAALLRLLEGRAYAIASNAPVEVVRQALAHLGDAAARVEIVALAPPFRPKPAPDLHLEACRRIAALPSESLAFEDSIIGATAARAAGLWVVGVGAELGLPSYADTHLDNLLDARVLELLTSPRRSYPSSQEGALT